MCILIHHPVGTIFSVEQLNDFYTKNSDGFGAIVKRGDTVDVIKSVGSIEEIMSLYHAHVAGYEAIIHYRMRTHGEIDISNCHPYEVVPGIWMAHNGVLSTGNSKDARMSDTWHYIQDYLKPLLERDPSLIMQPAFQRLVADHIGTNNRFGFMTQDGDAVILNRTSGVEHDGIWYSNTYAWSPAKFGYVDPYAKKYPTTYGSWYDQDDLWSGKSTYQVTPKGKSKAKPAKKFEKRRQWKPTRLTPSQLTNLLRQTYNAILTDEYDHIVRWVEEHPLACMNFLYEMYGSETDEGSTAEAISNLVNMDPYGAADTMLEIWTEEEEHLLDLAQIHHKKKATTKSKGAANAISKKS